LSASVALQTGQNRLDFLVRGERFTSYHPTAPIPGFGCLYGPGKRPLTAEAEGLSLWLGHGDVNGLVFGGMSDAGVRIRSLDLTARRGAVTVGFKQICSWLDAHGEMVLRDERIARVMPGPSEGRILDLLIRLRAPVNVPVRFGISQQSFLQMRLAPELRSPGPGQLRNSADEFGAAEMHGAEATYCAATGVVAGETVGVVFLDHPENPAHPPRWVVHEDGVVSPSPFAWQPVTLLPGRILVMRYRILVHRGYVNKGWAEARLAEFARDPAP
jgi:hypothetical protein